MPKRKTGYEEMLEDVIETLKQSPEEVNKALETSVRGEAANDLTKDELALIAAYVKADLKEFSESYEDSKTVLLLNGSGFHLARLTRDYGPYQS